MASSVPLGHSIPAHRVHDWCSHCPGRSLAEEVAAWQVDAQARHKAEKATETVTEPAQDNEAPYVSPNIAASTRPNRRCADCEQTTVHVVVVTTFVGSEERPIGEWAVCSSCGTCPHPVMEAPDA